jgi:hypothetical protein
MRIMPLLRKTGFVLFLFVIPFLLAVRLKWDAILPIIIYFQLLLIWAQVEIALRQHSLFAMQFKPSFDIKFGGEEIIPIVVMPPSDVTVTPIRIRNTSNNPAYNIMVGRLLSRQNEPIPPSQWRDKVQSDLISSLAPDEEVVLCSLGEELTHSEVTVEFSYFDQLGEPGTMYIRLARDGKILLIPERTALPGILLSTLEYFALFFKFLGIRRYFKR